MTKQLPLTQGKYAIVDDDVYEWASKFKWHAMRAGNTFYAIRNVRYISFCRTQYLHREIMNAPEGVVVDHTNGDGLNCTRDNMRLASQAENVRNSRMQSNNKSGFKGVHWHKEANRWQARIGANGKQIHLGLFVDPKDAALAYDAAAIKHHGEFAKTNF